LTFQGEPVGVEQIGRPVQRDRRLAGPRAALDEQQAGERGADDLVLLALDGRDEPSAASRAPGPPKLIGPSSREPSS